MSVLQLGEEVHEACVVDGRQPEHYHLDLLQVMVVTGNHPRLLLDEVCTASLNTYKSNPPWETAAYTAHSLVVKSPHAFITCMCGSQ